MKNKSLLALILCFCFEGQIIVAQNSTYPVPMYLPYEGTDQQNIHNYGPSEPFIPALIAEDFGPRQLNSDPYDWHGGIDYNSANDGGYGDILLAIEGGEISPNGLVRNGTKWITVIGAQHNYTYVHIFTCTPGIVSNGIPDEGIKVGGCSLLKMNPPNQNKWTIVFYINGQYSAIGPSPDQGIGYVTFEDELGQLHTLEVSSEVQSGDPIAPLGNSCGFSPHAHLQDMTIEPTNGNPPWSDEYAKNPLQYIDYEVSNNSIRMLQENDQTEGVTLTYPGALPSTLQARVQIAAPNNSAKRYNTVIDIEEVEFLIKKDYDNNFSLIKGSGNNRIKYGGIIGTDEYPKYINFSANNNNIGSWNKTGMEPFSYFDHPWDDFYCKDFITRIHKDDPLDGATTPTMLSYCPMSTRYNDGRYHIKARVTDVRNGYTDSPVQNVVIDNYKPFIRELKAQIGNQVIYRRTWQCDDGAACQGMYLEQGVVQISSGGDFEITS